jgi:hypothetical protein
MVAFGLTLEASWEIVAVTFQTALLNGGSVSLVYGMILVSIGSLALALSLGEMASMYGGILGALSKIEFLQGSCSWSSVSMDCSLCPKIYETRVLVFDTRHGHFC